MLCVFTGKKGWFYTLIFFVDFLTENSVYVVIKI